MAKNLEDDLPVPSKNNGITPYEIAQRIREQEGLFGTPAIGRVEFEIKTCKSQYSFSEDF